MLLEQSACSADPTCKDCEMARLLRFPEDNQVKMYHVSSSMTYNLSNPSLNQLKLIPLLCHSEVIVSSLITQRVRIFVAVEGEAAAAEVLLMSPLVFGEYTQSTIYWLPSLSFFSFSLK